MLLRILMLMVLSASPLLVSDAFAQVGGGFGSGLGGGFGNRSHGNRNGSGEQTGSDHKTNADKGQDIPDPNSYEQINYRLSLIQEDIKLTPNQLGAWLAFTGKVRAYAMDLAREKSYASASSFQTVGLQYIGQTIDSARNRLTALEDVEASAKALYLVLQPERKVLLDMRMPTVVAPRLGVNNPSAAPFERK